MTDKTARDVISKTLFAHQGADYLPTDEYECCADKVLEALDAAGYALVKLPAPGEWDRDVYPMWNAYPYVRVIPGRYSLPEIVIGPAHTLEPAKYVINPAEARDFAAALLAAARHAEEAGDQG